jgi:hypothetical protein
MANTFLTPQMITREALRVLHNKLTFIGAVNRQYDDSFAKTGAKIGDTLQIRLPNQYTVRTGKTLSTQDITEQSVALQLATQKGVDVNFSSAELTMELDDFSTRILEPAMAVLASSLEADAFTMFKSVYQQVGTAGTTPNTLMTYLQARAMLNNALTPMDANRTVHLSPLATASVVDSLKGLFQDSEAIKEQYREGKMGRTAGFDWYENPLVPTQTNGDIGSASTLTVSGANQTGSNLAVSGATNGNIMTPGTVFTIAGVYRVHPETKQATSQLQQFICTAQTTFTGTTGTIPISPAINTATSSGGSQNPLQNVTGSPAAGAAITVVGAANTSYEQEMAFHRDAFAFATADLVMPRGVDFAAREVYDGVSMRIVRAYDINNDAFPCRIDVFYGYQCLRPQMACRITS